MIIAIIAVVLIAFVLILVAGEAIRAVNNKIDDTAREMVDRATK